jgi:hypothetical protein
MAIMLGVPISSTVCTLRNIPFVFGRFEFYFALLSFVAGFSFTKNTESGSLEKRTKFHTYKVKDERFYRAVLKKIYTSQSTLKESELKLRN